MDRRSFLLGTGTILLSQLLAGCGQDQAILNVQLLKNSIPIQLINEFHSTLAHPGQLKLDFALAEQLMDLFHQLESWKSQQSGKSESRGPLSYLPFLKSKPPAPPDLVTLGDYWLASAIRQGLIQPLDPTKLQHWRQLPSRWQELVTRNNNGHLDPAGKVWAAPYRWGSTVIVYNRDKFQSLGWIPRDWSDLWRKEMRERISLLNQPREVIGLTLKKLGQSYNTKDLDQVPNLERELHNLQLSVKFYSSDTYLQSLVLGDTWLAVGWSTDVLLAIQRYPQIAAVVPESGTALWADLWVQPAQAKLSSPFSQQWIDFCWQPQIAKQISQLSQATSPMTTKLNLDDIEQNFRSLLIPNPQIFQRSEFLLPLPETTLKQYKALWARL